MRKSYPNNFDGKYSNVMILGVKNVDHGVFCMSITFTLDQKAEGQ